MNNTKRAAYTGAHNVQLYDEYAQYLHCKLLRPRPNTMVTVEEPARDTVSRIKWEKTKRRPSLDSRRDQDPLIMIMGPTDAARSFTGLLCIHMHIDVHMHIYVSAARQHSRDSKKQPVARDDMNKG